MQRIQGVTGITLVQTANLLPGAGEWQICYTQSGTFAQKLLVKLPSEDGLRQLCMHVHGSGIKINSANLVAEVQSLHPQAAAGAAARNLLTSAAHGGGPCL